MSRDATQPLTMIEQVRALPLEDQVAFCLQGHQSAIELFKIWLDVTQVWSALTAGQNRPSNDDVHRAMFAALVEAPSNEFFKRHSDSLPVLINAVANWRGASVLEQSDDRSLQAVAYVVRSDFANLLLQLSFLVGGPTWACQMAPLVRGCWNDQAFDSYLNGLAAKRVAARDIGVASPEMPAVNPVAAFVHAGLKQEG